MAVFNKEHTKGKRASTEEKHDKISHVRTETKVEKRPMKVADGPVKSLMDGRGPIRRRIRIEPFIELAPGRSGGYGDSALNFPTFSALSP